MNNHKLSAGPGGPWEIDHYVSQIEKFTERGAPPEVIESLRRKLAKVRAKFPNAAAKFDKTGKAAE